MELDWINLVLEISKLLIAIVGAIAVAWYWNRQKYRLDQYRYLDESYNTLLQLYFTHPQFGDRNRTRNYANSFKDTEAVQYHYFAMRVHTFLETIFDISRHALLERVSDSWKGHIRREWKTIFQHHADLHAAWLENHRFLHEPDYVARALRAPAAQQARGS